MFGSDATMLARLAHYGPVDPDSAYVLSRVSARLRPLAERLLAAGHGDRQAIWDEFLGSRDNPVSSDRAAHPHAGPSASRRRVKLTCAVDFEPRELEWLWEGRVPLGMITMFAGDPKLGKSFVTLAMAAAVSGGLPLPFGGFSTRLGSTILMSAEDDPARTIIPRLTAAGADLSRIHIVESVILANGAEALPSLRVDVDAVTAAASRLGDCRLIVIDPVSAYLNGVDDSRNAALRGALSPLKSLSERLSAGVVLVSHLTKASSSSAKHRVAGSIAYVGACRANFLFAADPHDPSGRRVLMLDNGGNVAPPAPTLAFTIEDLGGGPRVVWSDTPVPISVNEALRIQAGPFAAPEPKTRSNVCDDWLRSCLSGGGKPSAEILNAGMKAGFSKHQIYRAKSRIGARARKRGFDKCAQWYWERPAGMSIP
jgi:hypothetical protein